MSELDLQIRLEGISYRAPRCKVCHQSMTVAGIRRRILIAICTNEGCSEYNNRHDYYGRSKNET